MAIIIVLALLSTCSAFDKASFYGASSISYPLQEAKGVTDISFRFRTHLSDALLLLAAGKTDYCMIRLEGARLKLHINLGAGESELSSSKGVYLNDSQWHHVNIVRREANLTMKVDDNIVKKKLPGRFFELNIHYGLFLGGQGDFSELFLGHMENFRGCMEDVFYNGVKVMERARSRSGSVRVQGVTWNCASEFDADLNSDISFVDENSYFILPRINSRAGGRWHIEFKTITPNAMLLYNAGGGRGSDFLSVEILEGVVRVKMSRGLIVHTVPVSDGQWHKLHLMFNPSMIELSVDSVAMSTRIESGAARYLDLADTFYLGGIEAEKRQRAFAKGVNAADSSIMGCIRPVEVDDKPYGLPHALVTYGVSARCLWRYPCHEAAPPPCAPRAVCSQRGVDHFACTCDTDLCFNTDYAEQYKVYSKSSSDLELVTLYPLTVQEGGVTVITTQNIDVTLDHHKYGVRPSGVVLHVTQPPRHGRIAIDLSLQRSLPQMKGLVDAEGKSRQYFTLMDLSRDKVRYVHDGSENHQDAVVIDMELIPEAKFTLPGYLQGRNTFVLHVNVTAVNDPPVLNLPGKVLRLTQGTRKIITSDILKAEDPDTSPEDLLYTVLHGKNEVNGGHVEISGQPVDSFTQKDIDSGFISYVHSATTDKHLNKTSLKLTLQVSDGIETSGPGVLRVSVAPLQVRLLNNTGLRLVHNSYGIITSDNLTFATNADGSDVEVKYDIVKPPQFGVVERLRVLDGTWQTIDSFTSEMLAFGRVRYMHLLGSPAHDEFKFKASVSTVRTNTLYDFRLTFIKLELYQTRNEEVLLNNTREAFISAQHLKFATRPITLPGERILYTVLKPPSYGILHLSSGKRHLAAFSTFTQYDVDSDQLWYRLHRRAYSHIQDEFTFVVGASECANITGALTVRHTPAAAPSEHASGRVHTTLERLQVIEGSRTVVPATHLNFRTDSITHLVFNITHPPRHGKIEVIGDDALRVIRDNTTYFTLMELNADRVYYAHDDSESRRDAFHFMALSPEPEDFQYVGVFHIDIILKNDNGPARAARRVFRVVHNGARLVTAADLSYTDADLDTKPTDILYTVQRYTKEPANGGMFRADNPSEQMAQFTQDDIDRHRVLFKHSGGEYGKIAFWISDGLFDVNGVLEVQASPPFIRMHPTNGSIVESGKAVLLTTRDMQVDTNMNCLEEDIRYEITTEPKHGAIEIGDSQGTFTQLDVAAGRVAYGHREPKTQTDEFKFKVICLDVWGEGVYPIKIFPSSYWDPLRVSVNRPLIVEESTSANITRDILEVRHPQIEPGNIVYRVTGGPRHGWLETAVAPGAVDLDYAGEPVHTTLFDQSVVNGHRLMYVQAGVNRTRDKITLDVTNGIVWLRGVELTVIIVPERYYVSAANLSAVEGEAASVRPALFRTLTEYYRGKVVAYRVVEKPRHGRIVVGDQEINLMPVLKLNSGNIQYRNDGSEESADSMRLVAITEANKESEPFTLYIDIVPVNDESPIVAANTGLCVWEGGHFIFTRNELYVNDIDTPLHNVTISVVDIVSGHIAMIDEMDKPITRFTQADIDHRQVVFVHKDGSKGKMIFNVTDGLHELSRITFLITTKPVYLKLIRKQNVRVFPLMREPLTSYLLTTRCSDPNRDVVYKIERPPQLGRLVMLNDDHHRPIKRFTQQDLNDSLVYYEHTHPFSDLRTNDSFIFNIEAARAKSIVDQIFNIDISVSTGGLAQYVHIPPIKVDEGGKVAIVVNVSDVVLYLESRAGLRGPNVEASLTQPAHGTLQPPPLSLTQSQLEGGAVVYQHDDSDTLEDRVTMSLYLLPESVLLCNVTIPIQVVPVNDQPYRLVTETPQIRVVQGENYTITRRDLYAEDADTSASGIVYDVITGPTHGRILMVKGNSSVHGALSVNKFTQDDIDNERIVYEHTGLSQTATFYFRVGDGRFQPTYKVFSIQVIRVELNATSLLPIYLQQGSNVATVGAEQLYIETNADRTKVVYNITRQPQHGMIYVGRNPVNRFTHKDLTEKNVVYMQNDMTTSNDSYELVAYVRNSNTTATRPFTIEVIVQPLMALGDLRVEYDKVRVTLNAMDASSLATLTASDPLYTITRKPRYGAVKKIIRSSGEKTSAREREVMYFTHEDVKAGVIYFVTRKMPSELNGIEDSFRFLLAASIFQPAAGEVKVFIGNRPKKSMAGPGEPEGHEGVAVSNSDTSSHYMMILMALSGTILAIVVVFVLLKCRQYLLKDDALAKIHGQSQGVAPIPLPRPPDHLMPSPTQVTPTIKSRYVSSEQSMNTNASTPLPSGGSVGCKVTPLADGGVDLNARYPYGADENTDAEDWSSYEASESAFPLRPGAANPMLRRNQYWV